MLTFAQLTAPLTEAQVRTQLLAALQGLGVVLPTNSAGTGAPVGTGSVALSGTPAAAYSIVLKISTTGELGTAQYQLSVDGGLTFAGAVVIGASGVVVLSTTGVTATFAGGTPGGGSSFVLGDLYSFSVSVPTFPVSAWQSGSVPRTLVGVDASALSSFGALIAQVAAGGLLGTPTAPLATGPWLTLLARNAYGLERNAAVATQGTVVLTDTGGTGPYTIVAGQLYVVDAAGHRFNNVGGGVLAHSGTLSLTFAGESPGSAYNVANGTINLMATPLPGVTVNNPDPGSGSWITQQGSDEESDGALITRCSARWASLGTGATAAVYDLWARTAAAAVTRTLVITDPTTQGQVLIYLAGDSGGSGGGDVTAVQNYVNARVPLTANAVVAACSNVATTVTATVNYYAAKTTLSAVTAATAANLTALFKGGPIGSDAAGTTKLYLSAIIEQLMLATGVRNVVVTAPAADVALTTGQVATLTLNLAYVAV